MSPSPTTSPVTVGWFQKLLLILLGTLSIGVIGLSLWASVNSPQLQTRLDLRQTDLLLAAIELDVPTNLSNALGDSVMLARPKIYGQAKSAYLQVKQQGGENDPQLDLRLGILQAVTGDRAGAIDTWGKIQPAGSQAWLGGQILISVWADAYLLPDGERQLKNNLDGWYLQKSLAQLYRKQQQPEKLPQLATQTKAQGERAVKKLLLVNIVPIGGGFLGVIGWLILGWRAWRKASLDLETAPETDRSWSVPWSNIETWSAMAVWFASFIAISQVLLPIGIEYLHIPTPTDYLGKALWVLVPYGLSVIPPLGLVAWNLRSYWPLPWFRWSGDRWWWWAIVSYILAIPPVLVVSVLSQSLLGGKGGGNPLLPILLESADFRAQLLLWLTIGVCAPLAEELLFRGFLLPALTKNLSIGWSIGISGFAFGLVHLNMADLLPLTLLGSALGYLYYRSQNLLAPMLCHSLWNTGSFLALLALGQ